MAEPGTIVESSFESEVTGMLEQLTSPDIAIVEAALGPNSAFFGFVTKTVGLKQAERGLLYQKLSSDFPNTPEVMQQLGIYYGALTLMNDEQLKKLWTVGQDFNAKEFGYLNHVELETLCNTFRRMLDTHIANGVDLTDFYRDHSALRLDFLDKVRKDDLENLIQELDQLTIEA